jgi:hypothetical protein
MKAAFFALLLLLVIACNNKDHGPDVSKIKIDLKLERFDRDFFSIDSNNVLPGLNQLNQKYPILTNLFLQNILGLDSAVTLQGVRQFLHLSEPIYDSVKVVFKNADWLQKDFHESFRYVKYYFPEYKIPDIITVVGPIDALAQTSSGGYTPDFLGPDFMGISLQFYLGKNFSGYRSDYFIERVAPLYRSRRFSKEYILPDAMQLIVDDLFPDKSNGKPLIEQMIEKGKQWWMLDKFLPGTHDSLKTGFTKIQLDWCKENEGLIWSYLLKNEDIYSINPVVIQTYIGEGPFTQGFSQELSPGNIGQWIGWQIVKRFAEKNSSMKPEELMRTDAMKILEEAKYKPK